MNTLAPPGKGKGALLDAPIPKLTAQFYYQRRAVQAPASWQREAERLLAEYTRTRQTRHFVALARHLDGVFERLTAASKL
jgi:hypothetical protein